MHTIRLRGPWERIDRAGGNERIHLPADLASAFTADSDKSVSLLRRFGRPSNLSADDRVWLVICEAAAIRGVRFNETEFDLAGPDDLRFDVSNLLEANNRLTLEAVGMFGEVQLEIESS